MILIKKYDTKFLFYIKFTYLCTSYAYAYKSILLSLHFDK